MPEETRRVAAIAGRVTDAGTGLPIPGARIEIVDGPAEFLAWLAALSGDPDWERRPSRLDRAAARPDGLFYFGDLPAGPYHLRATAPQLGTRYGTVEATGLTVPAGREADGRFRPAHVELTLPPTTVRGQVTRTDSGAPLSGVQVRLRGDAGSVQTGADGRYLLTALVAGAPTIEASARGFSTAARATTLVAGQDQTVDIALAPA